MTKENKPLKDELALEQQTLGSSNQEQEAQSTAQEANNFVNQEFNSDYLDILSGKVPEFNQGTQAPTFLESKQQLIDFLKARKAKVDLAPSDSFVSEPSASVLDTHPAQEQSQVAKALDKGASVDNILEQTQQQTAQEILDFIFKTSTKK